MSDKENQINIELDEKTAEGTYSNLAVINHSVSEFVVDFISLMPGAPKAKVKSRVILTPQHAKKFLKDCKTMSPSLKAVMEPLKIMNSREYPLTLGLPVKLNIKKPYSNGVGFFISDCF